ncbi:unnamed protein product [Nyctereutes procyonoides]|uniref:(raccoon dog) hypothetical protein n=1 Tax=Nyctereutes procyonoides TaxID=34880 RepID=A0A811ZTD0_NYCPR|nr:unnamed protein product [Nyctereutes procyonoides]
MVSWPINAGLWSEFLHRQHGSRGQIRYVLSKSTRGPRAPAGWGGGSRRRGRGRAGNLPHPGSIRAPRLSRPVAPQSASSLDVAGGVGGRRAAGGGGARRGSRQVPGRSRGAKLARDAPRRGRAAASVQCARRGECVCVRARVPAFPFPPRQSSGRSEQRTAAGAPGRRSGGAPRAGAGAGAGSGSGSGSPRRARRSRSEARREQSARRRRRRRGEAAGPARPPPRLFPFSLHPLAPSPHALQGSQTGLQQRRRRRRGPPQSVPRAAALRPPPGAQRGEPGPGRVLHGSRASRGLAALPKSCSPAAQSGAWGRASSRPRAPGLCSAWSPARWTLLAAKPAFKDRGAPPLGRDS